MSNAEKLYSKAAKLRGEAEGLIDEAHAEQDEKRADELFTRAEKLTDEAATWDERASKAEKLATARLADAERSFDGPPERVKTTRDGKLHADVLAETPDVETIVARAETFKRMIAGERPTDAEAEQLGRKLPHERLWLRHLLSSGKNPMESMALSDDERRAYRAGMDAEAEASLRFMGVGQANAGAQTVPTIVAQRVVATMAWVGFMGDVGNGMTVTMVPPGGKLDVPQITDSHSQKAARVAEGAVTANTDLTTNKVPLAPEKRSFLIEVTEELIQANVVNFESRVIGLIAEFFGRAMNEDLTIGNGTAPNSAGLTSPAATAANRRQTAANDVIAEADVLALYALLDTAYEMDPTCRYQAHKGVVSQLMAVKGTGDWRAFPLSADRKLPIMPGAMPLEYNPNLAASSVGAAGIDLIVLGALSKYELAYAPLRTARDYDVEKDLHQIAFYSSWDGDFGDQRAFVRLENLG